MTGKLTHRGAAIEKALCIAYTPTTLAILKWETGLIGMLLFVLFLIFVTVDSFRLGARAGFTGAWVTGFFAVSLTYVLCLIFVNMLDHLEMLILYCYFAGWVVAEGVKGRRRSRAPAVLRPPVAQHG